MMAIPQKYTMPNLMAVKNRLTDSSMQLQKITSAIYGLAHTTDYTN